MGAVYASSIVAVRKAARAQAPVRRTRVPAPPRCSSASTTRSPGSSTRRIVEVYDYGNDAEGAFYTMELIEGARPEQGRAHAVARGLPATCATSRRRSGVLHARQLLHRDLSPRNLLRSAERRLKLIDFGALARFGLSTRAGRHAAVRRARGAARAAARSTHRSVRARRARRTGCSPARTRFAARSLERAARLVGARAGAAFRAGRAARQRSCSSPSRPSSTR